jgi:hypothetical protein
MLTPKQKALIDKLTAADNLDVEIRRLLGETTKRLLEIKSVDSAIRTLIAEKTVGFPWLAEAISQYYEFRDLQIAEFLETKLQPGVSAAQRVRDLAREKREFHRKFIVTRNLIRYYESLFPWLTDFVDESIDELLVAVTREINAGNDEVDPVRRYLSPGEYEALSMTERNQRALDRYWTSKKSSWQVGRDYERYIGYLYEQMQGYRVHYQGIERGLEDLGRDLICTKGDQVEIVQCKYWKKEKIIHEKHLNQLFGTTVMYFIEKNRGAPQTPQLDLFPEMLREARIGAALFTSAKCSDTARRFADALGIRIHESFPFSKYPSIKCNVSHQTGEKIYHLPLDQQYDRTNIDDERNEKYVATVREAESLGFRRAWKWRGE